MGETILVTGGVGYLGWHVCNELINRGYKVKVLDNLLYDFKPDERYEFIKGDIRNRSDVNKALRGVSAVVHLAALSNDPLCDVSPEHGIETNYNGTKLVAELAKQNGIKRFIYMSTCSVYGKTDEEYVDENSKVRPLSLYAMTKYASEQYLRSLCEKDFDVCILRSSTMYGYSKYMRFDLIVNIIAVEAVVDKQIKLFGGDQWRPLVHVRDVANAVVSSVEREEPFGAVPINIGSDNQNYNVAELTYKIQKNLYPEIPIKEFPENKDFRSYKVIFKRARELLNFRPCFDVIYGSKEVADAIRRGEFANPRATQYLRVKHLLAKGIK